ncbi:hypothetical protein AVEN_112611-1 [Araneus ventricosus]|uniref:Uncharacterized protein n=1 Tax=Araneus ventricosus TaxID=182803 RepID=A0A4Y2I9N1_ARAVE|nr:hypothetical protein AVEN_112611-1 [Araneus ventricosus]
MEKKRQESRGVKKNVFENADLIHIKLPMNRKNQDIRERSFTSEIGLLLQRLCDESGIIYKEDYNRLDPRLNKPRWPGGNVLASGAERSWFETRLHRVSGMYECLVHMKSDVKGQGSILVWELGWVLTLTTEPNPTGGTRIDPSNHFPLVQCGSDGVTARRLSPPFDHRLTRSLPK